jgi:drug/metabolite transporter (DMT)-like permease
LCVTTTHILKIVEEAMRVRDGLALVTLGAIWGASFFFIRVTAPVLGPFLLMELRVLLAGVALVLVAVLQRQPLALWTRWRAYVILGALNAAIPFSLIAIAELQLTASLAAILNATTPLWTAIVAAIWLKERLTPQRVVGLVLGVAGVALLVGWSPIVLTGPVLFAVGASLLAALFYGLGGVYTKAHLGGTPPFALAIGQQLGATVLLLPLAGATLPATPPSSGVLAAVLGLALLSTALAYLIYFYLIAQVGPTKTLSVTFLVPVFGGVWGTVFLDEPLTRGMFIGLAVVFLGVLLVTGVRFRAVEQPTAAQAK